VVEGRYQFVLGFFFENSDKFYFPRGVKFSGYNSPHFLGSPIQNIYNIDWFFWRIFSCFSANEHYEKNKPANEPIFFTLIQRTFQKIQRNTIKRDLHQ
jgi:hypothetical protein